MDVAVVSTESVVAVSPSVTVLVDPALVAAATGALPSFYPMQYTKASTSVLPVTLYVSLYGTAVGYP